MVAKTIDYDYTDEEGKLLYYKVRTIEPKDFRLMHLDENGEPAPGIEGCKRVFYRLPELLKGISDNKIIFLVEGEKDADTLVNLGLTATTTIITTQELSDDFIKILKNADVVILYDYDKTGVDRKDRLCKQLFSRVKRLRVVDLPGLNYSEKHGKDITDWLEMGHTIEELLKLVEETFDYTMIPLIDDKLQQVANMPQTEGINIISFEDFLTREFPPRKCYSPLFCLPKD